MTLTEVMPGWVGWLGPLVFLGIVAIWVLLVPGSVLASVKRRLVQGQHWTEQAALFYEGRTAIGFAFFAWPIAAITMARIFVGPYSTVPDFVLMAGAVVFVFFSVSWMTMSFSRTFGQPTSPSIGAHLWRTLKMWWPWGVLVGLIFVAPSHLFSPWMIPWLLGTIGALIATRYLPDLYLVTGMAHPAEGTLLEAVERASGRFGRSAPRSMVLQSYQANAAALPNRNMVLATSRLIDELDSEELEAIMTHELAHLGESRSVTTRRTLSTFLVLPLLAAKPLLGAGLIVLAAVMAGTVVLSVFLKRMQTSEESRADVEALEASHESTVFGETLLKMYRSALIPALVKRDPHGPLFDRLVRAGVKPDFGPDAPSPSRWRFVVATAVALVALATPLAALYLTVDTYDGDRGSHLAVSLGWNTAYVLSYTGYLRVEEGEIDTAVVYLEEAAELGDEFAVVDLAWALSLSGDCEKAAGLLPRIAASGVGPDDYDFANYSVDDCFLNR